MPESVPAGQPQPYAWVLAGYFDRIRDYSTFRAEGTNDWLLFFTLAGAGRLHTGGEGFTVKRGDLGLYAPHTPQDYGLLDARTRWRFLWFHFQARQEWLELLKWPAAAPGLFQLHVADPVLWARMREALRAAHRFASTARPYAKVNAMHA